MPVKKPKKLIEAKRRKVAMKLSLDPILIEDVRSQLRDGFSLSAHVSRLLREDLDRAAARQVPPPDTFRPRPRR